MTRLQDIRRVLWWMLFLNIFVADAMEQLRWLFNFTQSQVIARRYFIVNGFGGSLTMLGLLVGFYVSEDVRMPVVINACLGVAIAMGMSGVISA